MKHRVKFFYGLITIGILLAGFLLPRQILELQDRRQEERVDRYELNSVTLQVSSQLFEKLEAVKAGLSVETGPHADVRMTEEEVFEQMRIANEMFGVFALDMDTLHESEINQRLVIDEVKGISFIIWQGHMEDANCGLDVIIDDATGKMLGITTVVYSYNNYYDHEAYVQARELVLAKLEGMEERLKTYYELADVISLDQDRSGVNASYMDSNGIIMVENGLDADEKHRFQLVNEAGEYYDLEIWIIEGVVYSFN